MKRFLIGLALVLCFAANAQAQIGSLKHQGLR